MSKDASIAPKERVNIVYSPAEGNGREEIELPMKLLVMGDFAGASGDGPMEKREPVSINKDNFDEVMKAQGISLQLGVANRITDEPGDELQVSLKFDSLSDFAPQSIVQQVPELRRILRLREALRSLKGPLANVPDFRRKLQEVISNDTVRGRLLREIDAGKS